MRPLRVQERTIGGYVADEAGPPHRAIRAHQQRHRPVVNDSRTRRRRSFEHQFLKVATGNQSGFGQSRQQE